MALYLLQEDGSKLLLENLTGAVLLEASGVPGPTVFWQAGGAGHPVPSKRRRRRDTEQLFAAIEHSLEVALGLVVEPVVRAQESKVAAPQASWDGESFKQALQHLDTVAQDHRGLQERLHRVHGLLRAYEEAERQKSLDEEETWILMA